MKNSLLYIRKLVFLLLIFQNFSIAQVNDETTSAGTDNSDKDFSLYEKGFLPTFNFSSNEYKSMPQNWAIVEDKRGIMYFGNNEGVLEYDGVYWRVIKTPNESRVVSLAIDDNSKVYVGAYDEFGYLAADSIGKMTYHSLVDQLDQENKEFGWVWRTYISSQGVYFRTLRELFFWDGQEVKVWDATTSFQLSIFINDMLYIHQDEIGLTKVEGDSIVLIPGGDLFANKRVTTLLPFEKDQILIITERNGLFVLSINNEKDIVALPTEAEEFLLRSRIYNGIKLKNHWYSIGTWGDGVVFIDNNGKLIQTINKSSGLQDGIIQYQYVDNKNNLWLALSKGISRVEYNSPISFYNDKTGLEGIIETITRHNGVLYVGTHSGVYYLPKEKGATISKHALSKLELSHFKSVKGHSMECWDLLSFTNRDNSILMMAMNDGVYELNRNDSSIFIARYYPWVLHQSLYDPSRVFIGLDDGIASIYRENGKWIDEGKIEVIDEQIRNIAEDGDGNLWLGTDNQGVIQLKTPSFSDHRILDPIVIKYDSTHGLPDGPYLVEIVGGDILISTGIGPYRFNDSNHRFMEINSFGNLFEMKDRGIHRMKEDKRANIWMVTYLDEDIEIGIIPGDEGYDNVWISTPFVGMSKEIIQDIYHDDNDITWLGGPEGLFKFDAKVKKDYKQSYRTSIRQVVLGDDSVIFWGTYVDKKQKISMNQLEIYKPILPYSENSLTFYFAAQCYDDESAVRYKYFLEGFDDDWSDWKDKTTATRTNLPEGEYFFRVKAINIFENESTEAVYEFTILPPWHRTIWAYIGYVLLFIGFVYGAITFSTRGLKAIIRERTAEIVEQKEEIEEKNRDITDSINYAKKIQDAMLPSSQDMASLFPDSFIFYHPKDIVSGDFYWLTEKDGKSLIAVADCTGHGVPGAFMSMIGNSLLNEIVNDKGILEPALILDQLKEGVIKALKQKGETGESQDGMDIAFCTFDLKNNEVEFAGAYNSLYIIRENVMDEVKADRMPIGVYAGTDHKFTNNKVSIQKGDILYFFSDGFTDQSGGPRGKKFMRKRFKELILGIHEMTMPEQLDHLYTTFEEWKGDLEQNDDICMIGIKV